MHVFSELVTYKQFLREFTLQQLRSRYRGSVLGFGWSLLVPFATIATFGFVFAYLNRANMQIFWPFFIGGFVPWNFFALSIGVSVVSIVGNPQFITKTYAPKAVFPVAAFLTSLIETIALFISAFIILAVFGYKFPATVLFMPVSLAILMPFVLGACLLLAAANVFFRDVAFIWTALQTLLFFLTPILYSVESLPPNMRPLFEANPLYPFVRLFQDPLLGTLPPGDLTATAALYAAIMLTLGASVFSRTQKSFYLYL